VLYAFLVAAIVIFVAEQGDKTQILAFALATKYRAWQVLLGIFSVNLVVLFLFTLLGRVVGSFLPEFWLWVISGTAFVAFGAFTLLAKDEKEADVDDRFGRRGPVLTAAGLFFLAEIGDQAELITMAIAANPAGPLGSLGALGTGIGVSLASLGVISARSSSLATFVGVWLGAVVGIMLADGIGVAAGRLLGRRLPEKILRRVSGTIFVVAGVVVLGLAVRSRL
jgi:putative Ca2+/H+ antiporter (TMEM165/GDT1 family)